MPAAVITGWPRAGLWRRLAALLYDAFLVAAIWMLLGFLVQLGFGVDGNQVVDGRVHTEPHRDGLLFSLMLASCAGFYCYFWTRSGQTLGMMAWRLQVVGRDNRLLTPGRALQRFVLAWPALLAGGAGYLWLYLDPNGDALHDRLSRTKVVLVPKSRRCF